MRSWILAAVFAATLAAPSPATASVPRPTADQQLAAARRHVHQLVRQVHAENRRDVRPLVRYRGWPDRYRLASSVWRAAFHWRAQLVIALKQPSLYVPPPVVTTLAPVGDLWGCVARQEEGGANDPTHGYFGFMGTPADFGHPELGSWSAASFAEQVAVAEGVLAASGVGAWGPLTRAACWGA